MNPTSLRSVFLLSLLGIFLFSCSSIKPKDVSNENLVSYYYKTFKINSTKPLDGLDSTYFVVTYPEFSDDKINKYVQTNIVLDSGKTSVEEMGKEFIGDYDQFYDEVEFKRPWYQEKRDSVDIQTASYIGFSSHFASYTGGAHGLYYISFNNYSINENRELLINDIVEDEFQDLLTKIAEDIFRKQEGIPESHSLTDGYFFDEGIFSLPKNFILQEDGILFLYNIYEIKAYVFGDTKLFIPYTSILNMLTLKGKKIIEEIKNKGNANI